MLSGVEITCQKAAFVHTMSESVSVPWTHRVFVLIRKCMFMCVFFTCPWKWECAACSASGELLWLDVSGRLRILISWDDLLVSTIWFSCIHPANWVLTNISVSVCGCDLFSPKRKQTNVSMSDCWGDHFCASLCSLCYQMCVCVCRRHEMKRKFKLKEVPH